jgi:hypothetical protein
MVNEAEIFTQVFTENFTLRQGARTIDLYNSGGGTVTFTGNQTQNNNASEPVNLVAEQAYSFGDLGKPYPPIDFVVPLGTSLEIVATY